MHIVDAVATDATGLCLFVIVTAMALTTFHFLMGARQWKGSRVMIKTRLAPGIRSMTVCTLLALAAAMNIFLPMAVYTLVGCITEFVASTMALVAGHRNMLARQWKICQAMIEPMRIQLDDISLYALMFRMTQLAFTGFDTRLLAMKSPGHVNITPDLFVTG